MLGSGPNGTAARYYSEALGIWRAKPNQRAVRDDAYLIARCLTYFACVHACIACISFVSPSAFFFHFAPRVRAECMLCLIPMNSAHNSIFEIDVN